MESQPTPKRLLDQVRDVLRLKHYSFRTEQAYVGWITRDVLFHDKHHPKDMTTPEVEAFLTHLVVEEIGACHQPDRPQPPGLVRAWWVSVRVAGSAACTHVK